MIDSEKLDLKELLRDLERLKEREREGWNVKGLPKESVAEHSYGTCFFTLLLIESINKDINKEKCLKYSIIHDFYEAQLSDFDDLSKKYINKEEAEKKVMKKRNDFLSKLFKEYKTNTIESKIVNDADKLDMINRASKLKDLGFSKKILNQFIEKEELNFDESKEILESIESN